jgi:hypothetical protein
VSLRLPITQAQVQVQGSPCRICDGQVVLKQVILRAVRGLPCQLSFHPCVIRGCFSPLFTRLLTHLQMKYRPQIKHQATYKSDQTGKGIPTRSLCQKNQGSVKIKQKPVKVGDRTTHGTLSHERTPFQSGINGKSQLRKVPRERCISHTYPM